jgi:2-polyprenyl-3-methyl-5-hydroxy-6-metoxy-1,4-benzoquinol methylase
MSEHIDFSERAQLEEEMDAPCSYEEMRGCLRDLAVVNRLTRAHQPIMDWLERVAGSQQSSAEVTSQKRDLSTGSGQVVEHPVPRALRIVDVGCGYGDMLRRIERWAVRSGVAVELVGVDVNANAVRAAREATPATSRIEWIHGDVYASAAAADADVVTTCGVIHHMAEAEIVRFLRWAEETARVGWFFIDLHRKPVPYYVFNVLMRGGWWHRFIRHDGLRSIRRSFLAEDWQRMCAAAGIDLHDVEIREHRPARLCVGRVKVGPHPSR